MILLAQKRLAGRIQSSYFCGLEQSNKFVYKPLLLEAKNLHATL